MTAPANEGYVKPDERMADLPPDERRERVWAALPSGPFALGLRASYLARRLSLPLAVTAAHLRELRQQGRAFGDGGWWRKP